MGSKFKTLPYRRTGAGCACTEPACFQPAGRRLPDESATRPLPAFPGPAPTEHPDPQCTASVPGPVSPAHNSRNCSPAANLGVVIYVAHVYGVTLDPLKLVAGVVVSALVSIAAVGVASSVTFFVTLVPISTAMGVPMELLPLLLPVETLPDFSRTIANVTGDVGVTAWAARWRGGTAKT